MDGGRIQKRIQVPRHGLDTAIMELRIYIFFLLKLQNASIDSVNKLKTINNTRAICIAINTRRRGKICVFALCVKRKENKTDIDRLCYLSNTTKLFRVFVTVVYK